MLSSHTNLITGLPNFCHQNCMAVNSSASSHQIVQHKVHIVQVSCMVVCTMCEWGKLWLPKYTCVVLSRSILESDVMDLSNSLTLWPLSSYSPIGGISMFPGTVCVANHVVMFLCITSWYSELDDVSAEEMRWDYNLAQGTNKLQEYVSVSRTEYMSYYELSVPWLLGVSEFVISPCCFACCI